MKNTQEENTALISVIVPVYKVEQCIRKCIESILNQTHRNLQLLLIDDGSPDNSGAICDEYAQLDRRIDVIHTSNRGVSAARNQGIELAAGEYISFVDSDDYIDNNFLADAYDDITKKKVDLYISGLNMETFKYGKMIDSVLHQGMDKEYSVKELFEAFNIEYPFLCICGIWCKLYRTDIIRKFNIRFATDMTLGEDSVFICDYLQYTDSIYFSSNVAYHYFRGNNESLFSRYYPDLYEINVRIYERMRSLLVQNKCANDTMWRFDSLYARIIVGCVYHEYLFCDKSSPKSRKEVIHKAANNRYVQQCSLRNYKNPKDILVMVLLKAKMYRVVYALFHGHYCRT